MAKRTLLDVTTDISLEGVLMESMTVETRRQYFYKLFTWLIKQLEESSNWKLNSNNKRIINIDNPLFNIVRLSYKDAEKILVITDIFFVVVNGSDGTDVKYNISEYTEFMPHKDIEKFKAIIDNIFSDLIREKNAKLLYEGERAMYSFIETLKITLTRKVNE